MAVPGQYLAAVKAASAKYGVPADLLGAQIGAESGWNPNAKSPAGAEGISQFMPGTAKGYGIDPMNPMQSIDAQGKMMSSLLKSYKGNVPLALAAYNAGAGEVAKAGGKVPNIPETQNYIKRIMATRSNYPGLAAASSGLSLPSGVPAKTQMPAGVSGEAPKTLSAPTQGVGSPGVGTSIRELMGLAQQHLSADPSQAPAESPLDMLTLPSGGVAQSQPFAAKPVNPLVTTPSAAANPSLSPEGSKIVAAAMKFKGAPYSWGGGGINGPTTGIAQGAGTKGFDCSALLQYSVHAATGQVIPRTSQAQYKAATKIPPKAAKPGDAVFFDAGPSGPGHVGIYLGNGKYIESPHTGDVVKVATLADAKGLVGFGRF